MNVKSLTKQFVKNRKYVTLKGNLGIVDKSKNRRIVAGYGSVAVVDSEKELIPLESLKKGANTLLNNPDYANVMLVHENIQIGKIIPNYGKLNTHVDDKGLFIVCELRDDLDIANAVWQDILDGMYAGFSIGCEVLKTTKEILDDEEITILEDINLFEVSICSKPINEQSGFIVISKSCEEECLVNNKVDNMAKKTKKDEKSTVVKEDPAEEKPTKTPTPDTDEKPKPTVPEEPEEEGGENPPVEEEPTKTPTPDPDKKPEPEGKSKDELVEKLGSMEAKINALEKTILEMSKPDEPEPEEEEEEVEKSVEDEPKVEDSFDVKAAFDKVFGILEEMKSNEEIMTELKARDDQINALEEKLKTLISKSNEKAEIVTKSETDNLEEEEEGFVYERGTYYKKA